jgi:hypothetical protein
MCEFLSSNQQVVRVLPMPSTRVGFGPTSSESPMLFLVILDALLAIPNQV